MAEEQAQEQMDEVLDYTEGELAAEHADAVAADADEQQQPAAENTEAGGDAQMEEKQVEAGKMDPLSQPPHGTEVYASNIPMEATEDQIRAFFGEMGEVYQLRLPKNPDGKNRGFGFVVYKTREAAANAVEHLNGKNIPDLTGPAAERKVRVNESQVKNKLYVGNLPRSMTQHQVEEELKTVVVGLEGLELMMDKENPEVNRGFGFLTFYNYACADAARRKLAETEFQLGGRPLTITWAEPKKEEDTSRVRAVYVGNLPETISEQKLIDVFKAYGEIEKVMLPYSKEDPSKYRDYGFVHFKDRASALQAIARAEDDKPKIDDKEVTVHMAKPQHEVHQSGYQSHGSYGGAGRGTYGQQGYGQQGYSGYGQGRGRGGYGSSSYGRGGGRGYGRGRGYGTSAGSYGGGGGYGEEEYADEGYGEDAGYASAAGSYAGYTAAAAAPAAAGGTMMMPVQLPNGQVGYMVMPAAGAAGAGGPMRRGVAAAGYGTTGYGATGYGAGAAAAYGQRAAGGYVAGGARSSGYGSQVGRAGRYGPY